MLVLLGGGGALFDRSMMPGPGGGATEGTVVLDTVIPWGAPEWGGGLILDE